MFGLYRSKGRGLAMCRGFHGDLVKQLMGQLTAFPVAFFIYFIQDSLSRSLRTLGKISFSPSVGKADTCSSYEHGHLVMAP